MPTSRYDKDHQNKLKIPFGYGKRIPGTNVTGVGGSTSTTTTVIEENQQVEAVVDFSGPKGTPVTVSKATGHLIKSDAASKPLSFVVGLLVEDSTATFPSPANQVSLELTDWTAITGTASLQQGYIYFLAVGGNLTTTPPSYPNNITVVGMAISPTKFRLNQDQPIAL